MEEARSLSSSPSSPSSERIDESPNGILSSSSTFFRSEPPSSHINPTAILQSVELDSAFEAYRLPRSELPIERTQLNGWQPQNPIAMLGSSISFGGREEQLREMLNQAGAAASINLFQHQLPHPIHQMNNWMSPGLQGMNYPAGLNRSLSRYHRNSIYDPMYETIGLPVDPHLRMFTARRNG